MLKKNNKKKKIKIDLIFKRRYFLVFILVNVFALIHLNLIKEIPKFHGELKLYPKKLTAEPINYHSNEILDGMFDYRIITEKSYNELSYPKLNDITFEEFEKLSLNTRLKKFSSNNVENRLVEGRANDLEIIKSNIKHFVNIHYEHYYKNFYLKRKKLLDDKLSFTNLLKEEFKMNLTDDPIIVQTAITKLLENEKKYRVIEKLFFTKMVNFDNIIHMPFNDMRLKPGKPTPVILFTVYNIVGILVVFVFLSFQLILIKLPAINIKFK